MPAQEVPESMRPHDRLETIMRIRVDSDKCEGHNRCYSLAGELFEVDDYGYATEVGDGTVPAEFEEKARLAVDNCPEYAITIED